jgi:hypothetical protein
MKFPRFFLSAVVISLLSVSLANAQSSPATLYSEAQRAYLAGDSTAAKDKFLAVLAIDPSHIGAKNYLKTILTAEKKNPKSGLSAQLAALIVPKVSFKEASFQSVLDYLKAKASEISQNQIATSFVLQTNSDTIKETPITLELANVPYTEVLRYLGEMTGTTFEIQQYAIVVKPRT